MRTSLITLFFVATLIGFDCAIEEIPKEVEEAKRGLFSRPVNPYSWMNRGRRSLDDADFGDPVDVLSPMNKRGYRRNPYSWQRSFADTDQAGFLDSLFGMKDKKSPYMAYSGGRRARNPYSWRNFI